MSAHNFSDLTGQKLDHLTVLKFNKQTQKWICQCDCEDNTIVEKKAGHLKIKGRIQSCGCANKMKFVDITNKRFGHLTAIEYSKELGEWKCKCDCGEETYKKSGHLRNGLVTTCGMGCQYSNNTSTDINVYKNIINESIEVKEQELLSYIESIYSGEIIKHNKSILNGQELDIYIPEKKIAIEFNGNYWHSLKDKNYHQDKTIQCAKNKIHLIHVFEYEWDNKQQRDKIKNYIYNLICNNTVIYARNTLIKEIDNKVSKEFLDKYHLQEYTPSKINLGCFYSDKLIGEMTFGKPHFNNGYQYELLRLCWLPTIKVIGGTEKLFTHFVTNYNPQSIICYSDISKFTGNIYLRCGFKPIQPKPITKPNYVWVSHHGNEVLKRYQTQKHKLLKRKLGTENQTEDEIMISNDYYKIYDSGNIRLEWRKQNGYR